MFKVKNKVTRTMWLTTRLTSFWCLYCWLWIYFLPFSKVNACLDESGTYSYLLYVMLWANCCAIQKNVELFFKMVQMVPNRAERFICWWTGIFKNRTYVYNIFTVFISNQISRLPEKLESIVSENGSNFSVGERQ